MPEFAKSRNINRPASAPAPGEKTTTLSEDAIRARAYERFERRGGEPGHEDEDWWEAERELKAEIDR